MEPGVHHLVRVDAQGVHRIPVFTFQPHVSDVQHHAQHCLGPRAASTSSTESSSASPPHVFQDRITH